MIEKALNPVTQTEISTVLVTQAEIRALRQQHDEICKLVDELLKRIFQIGETLHYWQSERVPVGQWLNWIEKNLPIRQEIVDTYLRIWENRTQIDKYFKIHTVAKLPSLGLLDKIEKTIREKERSRNRRPSRNVTEFCPTCGQPITKRARAYINRHAQPRDI
jgi:hypothetical protein